MEFIAAVLSLLAFSTGDVTLMQASSITPEGVTTVTRQARATHAHTAPPRTANYLPRWTCKRLSRASRARVCTTKVRTPDYSAKITYRYTHGRKGKTFTAITYKKVS